MPEATGAHGRPPNPLTNLWWSLHRRRAMAATAEPKFLAARHRFYDNLVENRCLLMDHGIPSVADGSSAQSCKIAAHLFANLNVSASGTRLSGQRAGAQFETVCAAFLKETFLELSNIRPGHWQIDRKMAITEFDQYDHLLTLSALAKDNADLAAAMVSDYLVEPDIVIARYPIPEQELLSFVDDTVGLRTPLRAANGGKPLLHASVSCKWTIRSDRSQNTRSEALSLVRNRKGPLPHIVAITAEPLPQRITSIAMGTGDMDCVYHIALPELEQSVMSVGSAASQKSLATMISGKLLRDIADLPLDLAI